MKRFFMGVFLLLILMIPGKHQNINPSELHLKNTLLCPLLEAASQSPLEPLVTGSKGRFPYYWQDPRNLQFNETTYRWISSSLRGGVDPLELDQPFINLYIDALSKVTYSLSTRDQADLRRKRSSIANHQVAILKAWEEAYGSLPQAEGSKEIIDNILHIIVSEWADPSTTLHRVQQSSDISALLNRTPASGRKVLSAFIGWVNAVNEVDSLVNNVTMNNAYLSRALEAAQKPSAENGGMLLSGSPKELRPAYRITTPMEEIFGELGSTENKLKIALTLLPTSDGEYSLTLKGSHPLRVSMEEVMHLIEEEDTLKGLLPPAKTPAEIIITFSGIAMVNFGPVPFDKTTGRGWYWMKPIEDAIENGDRDVSGFKFSPKPQIDFSRSGTFGFITGVLISKDISLTIRGLEPNSSSRKTEDTPLSRDSQPSAINNEGEVFLNYTSPKGDGVNPTAFIIGVQTSFPAASD